MNKCITKLAKFHKQSKQFNNTEERKCLAEVYKSLLRDRRDGNPEFSAHSVSMLLYGLAKTQGFRLLFSKHISTGFSAPVAVTTLA